MPNEGSYEAAVRRSDEIQADLAEHAGKYNMLTGDRPTGRLHLVITLAPLLSALDSKILVFIPILLTTRTLQTEIPLSILQIMSTIWLLIICTELIREGYDFHAFYGSSSPTSLCCRSLSLHLPSHSFINPTVKAEQEASGHALTGLLLPYPVRQACDILFCKVLFLLVAISTSH